jgi:DNA-binding NtrC family response regulator
MRYGSQPFAGRAAGAVDSHQEPGHEGPARSNNTVAMIGQSVAMWHIERQLRRLAPTPLTVVVHGETGAGKELAARALPAWSDRADHPFIAVDCGALSEHLLESELFGHRKGAFTGAESRRAGYFEQAYQGTLFLDEIANLWHCQLNEKSLTDAFLVRKADGLQVAKREGIVQEENQG